MLNPAQTEGPSVVESLTISGAPGSQAATYDRPKPRASKEKVYRELLTQRQTGSPQNLVTWTVEMMQLLRTRDEEARRQQARDIATFYQYYDCNEYGEFDESGQWIPDAQDQNEDNDDFMYSVPLVPAHVDAAKTLLLKTSLEYEYTAVNKISVLDGQVAAMAKELAEEDIERLMTDDLRIREILYMLLAGKSYRCHYWARNPLEPETVEIPVYSNEEVQGDSFRVCGNPECQTPLKPEDEICTRCMGTEISTIEGGKMQKSTSKNQTVTLAHNQMYVPNPLAVQHDLSKTNINASFLIERDALPRAEAEFLYQQVITSNQRGISEGTRMIRELERARLRTSNLMADQQSAAIRAMFSEHTELVERERAWLVPWQYANLIITEDHWYKTDVDGLFWCEDEKELPEGSEPVKSGTFLGDIYPGGLFLCVVDDNLIEISGGSVADSWVKVIFGTRPANADGAGLRRLRPLADMANDSTNLEFKTLMDDADPKTFLDKSYLSHLSKAGEYNLVDGLKEGHNWDNVVHRLEGAAAHPALGQMNENVQAFAQFMVGTFSSIGAGAPDVKAAGTATGVVKMAEEAAGRYLEGVLLLKAADIESRYKILTNIKKNSIEPQKQELVKRFGTEVTNRFFSCSLRQIVSIGAKRGTDQPQSQAIKLAQMEAYGQAIANIGDNPNALSLMESMAEMIDLPITVGQGLIDKEEANRRIGLLRDRSQQYTEKNLPPDEVIKLVMQLISSVIAESESEISIEQIEMMAPLAGGSPAASPPPAQPPPAMPQDVPSANGNAAMQPMPPQAKGQMPAPPPMQQQPEAPSSPDEQAPQPAPAVIMMQNHPVFMDAYKDCLLTECARLSNTVFQGSVQMMWKLHYAREIAKQQELMRVEGDKQMIAEQMKADFAAKNAPPAPPPVEAPPFPIPYKDAAEDIKRQMEVRDGLQPSQVQPPQADDGSAGVISDVVGRIADDHAKDADFQREQESKNADLNRELIKSDHSHEQGKEMADIAAKNTNSDRRD